MDQPEKIPDLLKLLELTREKLEVYVYDLELLKDDVTKLFPDKIDYRNKWTMDERVKTTTGFYDSLLRMRQEIAKNIKDEIEIRRKLTSDEKNKDFEESDIRRIVDILEKNKEVKKNE